MILLKRINIYFLCFILGFISCWYVFNINFLYKFYENVLNIMTHRGLVYFILFTFIIIFSFFLRKIITFLLNSKKHIKIANILILINTIIIISLIYIICENFVKNWKTFTINVLNYMLYMFAWYSLIKAVKVWCKYGNFFNLLLQKKIKTYILRSMSVVIIISLILFSQKFINPVSAIGILLISTLILLSICLFITLIIEHSKKIQSVFEKMNIATTERIIRQEQPKEVSIAYDQISVIGLSAVVGKRIFDVSKNVDLQFIVSKLFKMCCYLTSLSVTCKYTKQIKKLKKSITFFCFIIIFLFCLSYSDLFHDYIIKKPQISKIANYIIDYLFFPLGIIKILIQISTIIFAKKTTGVSVTYFTISAFFTLITSCNLIAKGNFHDTTITISLFKCFLYLLIVLIVAIINKRYPSKS